jgi:hypothetical protein
MPKKDVIRRKSFLDDGAYLGVQSGYPAYTIIWNSCCLKGRRNLPPHD